jgi:hypothetical protein
MGDVRYAVRVRGHSGNAVTVAGQEGLDVAIDPERTLLRGRLPDQAALFGILAMARLLGLEVIEVRRCLKRAVADEDRGPDPLPEGGGAR